jgi:hypothetical protein
MLLSLHKASIVLPLLRSRRYCVPWHKVSIKNVLPRFVGSYMLRNALLHAVTPRLDHVTAIQRRATRMNSASRLCLLSATRAQIERAPVACRDEFVSTLWRTHSCVPCRDSSRHLDRARIGVGRVPTRHARVRAPRIGYSCFLCDTPLARFGTDSANFPESDSRLMMSSKSHG